MAANSFEQLDRIADRLLAHVPFFKGLTKSELFTLLGKAVRKAYPPGAIVFREGEPGDGTLYIVMSGKVDVVKQLTDGTQDTIDTFGMGSCFGEMALIDNQPRSATILVKEATQCLVCSRDVLAALNEAALKIYENLANIIVARYLELERQIDKEFKPVCYSACDQQLTEGISVVANEISPRSLIKLAELGEPYNVPARTYVVKQNTYGQNMYFVLDGELEVRKPTHKDEYVVLATLARGNYFGEMALVSANQGRMADVIAITEAKLVRLNANHLKHNPEIGAAVYHELAKIFSLRLRRVTQVYMQTIARNCSRDCPLVQEPKAGAGGG
jgi:CRP-like cAMP-binding protein